jgi:hypothetical protein
VYVKRKQEARETAVAFIVRARDIGVDEKGVGDMSEWVAEKGEY